jgi:N-acetylated-alpha-linked acidic dipeptidase
MRLANADVLPFDYTDYANQLQQFFNEAMKFAKEYKLDSSLDEKAMNNAIEEFGKAAERAERIQQRASSQTGDKAKLANINDTLIAVEREFTDERGLRGRSWYKHQIYAPGIYTGYAAQPLTDFRQSIDDRNSTNTRESLQRIVEAIKRATERLREIHD